MDLAYVKTYVHGGGSSRRLHAMWRSDKRQQPQYVPSKRVGGGSRRRCSARMRRVVPLRLERLVSVKVLCDYHEPDKNAKTRYAGTVLAL
jgi:hypothetical protein